MERSTEQSSTVFDKRNPQKKQDRKNANKLGQEEYQYLPHSQNTVNSQDKHKLHESTLENLVGNDLDENSKKREEFRPNFPNKNRENYKDLVASSDMDIFTVEGHKADKNKDAISITSDTDTATEVVEESNLKENSFEDVVTSVTIKKEMLDNTQPIEEMEIHSAEEEESNVSSQEVVGSSWYYLRSNRTTGKYNYNTQQQGMLRRAVHWGENLAGARPVQDHRRKTMGKITQEQAATEVVPNDKRNKMNLGHRSRRA